MGTIRIQLSDRLFVHVPSRRVSLPLAGKEILKLQVVVDPDLDHSHMVQQQAPEV